MPVSLVQMTHNNQFMSWMFWQAMKMMLIMFNLGWSVRIVSYFVINITIPLFHNKISLQLSVSVCSGCAVPSRSSMSDTKEENVPKFKNSWSVIPSSYIM